MVQAQAHHIRKICLTGVNGDDEDVDDGSDDDKSLSYDEGTGDPWLRRDMRHERGKEPPGSREF